TSRFDHVKDNRLKQWANQEYKYDAWGNLIEKTVGIVRWQTFIYDCENRLVKTETMADTQVESTSSYQYDSLGRRVAKQSEIKGRTDHKRFLWQGLRMLREGSPGQSSLYLYEPGSYAPLARVDEKEGEVENKVYYFHTDQIGTPLEMTDTEGQIVWQAKYRAWGAVEKLVVDEVEQNLRFQGQYFGIETGLHYNTFRYYDPEIGRFITQDPIGLAGGFNLYQYAPNPSSWVDPWGWMPFWKPLKPDGMGHHPFPRAHANTLGFLELGTKLDSPSWFSNEVDGSDKLHQEFHDAIKKEGVPFNKKFDGTPEELVSKLDKAYQKFPQKGTLKVPRTGQVIAKNVTIGEALSKSIGKSADINSAGGCG
ncbi:RHS repeat domain-containing protein, partial [Pseudomonas syringae group genomosp. 7]|uniref:RHS repeat domain-containing protein n=1 Tax=Pseudomonas syringae group genomosp. 7 TaxID=251699 RepID=UPI0016051D4B